MLQTKMDKMEIIKQVITLLIISYQTQNYYRIIFQIKVLVYSEQIKILAISS